MVRVARRTVSATVTVVSDGNLLPQGFTSFSSGGQQPVAATTTIATAAVPSTSTASPEVTETHNMEVTMGSTVKLPCRQVRCRRGIGDYECNNRSGVEQNIHNTGTYRTDVKNVLDKISF